MEQTAGGDAVNHEHFVKIIVNTRPVETDQKTLDYAQAVKIAYPDGDPGTVYNVTYRKGDGGKEGMLVPGGPSVKVVEGMIFDVHPTTES